MGLSGPFWAKTCDIAMHTSSLRRTMQDFSSIKREDLRINFVMRCLLDSSNFAVAWQNLYSAVFTNDSDIQKGMAYQVIYRYNLKTVKCECGVEILLIPDVKEMGRLIDIHAEEHGKKEKNREIAKSTIKRIQDLLTGQVLEKARDTKQ